VVLITYHTKDGMRDEFLKVVREMEFVEKTVLEHGCMRFEMFIPVKDDGNTVFLLENWLDDDSITKHKQSDHYIKYTEIKDKYLESTDVVRYRL